MKKAGKKANNEENNHPKPMVFLNTPIHNKEEDIIGFQTYVDTLQEAINKDAQMIAITSPFGAGKSSVTELLRAKKEDQKVVNISMWSHLCKQKSNKIEDQTIELHRSFLYQIVSKLNPDKGTYISRRLSKNYGLLKLHTESPRYYWAAFLALIFFMLGYVLPYVFNVGIPPIFGTPEFWNGLFILIAVVCLVYIIVRAEVVFSSQKSEGALTIDENELKELYRKFVVKYCAKEKNKVIFVIEDLDRTGDDECVISFIKELRKYYILENNDKDEQNRIVFIVNVKPESSLIDNYKQYKFREQESLYDKLFDFVLNIPTINIDDYETVLKSILQKNEKNILQMMPEFRDFDLIDIPGMQWIIYGKNFGIRDVKDRLNRAFSLYLSLKGRFHSSAIEFEKCAVVAYLTTAYEKEFISTDDNSFGILVEKYLQHTLTLDSCINLLVEEEYAKEVFSLIENKHIDTRYRMYFYNYPENSKIYSYEEQVVQNAILYGDTITGIEDIILRVITQNINVVYEALDKIKKLKIGLPDIVFKNESLFTVTLRYYPDGVYDWISKLDYSSNAFEKTCNQIVAVLSFDQHRTVYSYVQAIKYCEIWEEKMKENELLQFRSILCSKFSNEILWYRCLFMNVHNIVSLNDLDKISLKDAIQIINIQKDSFNVGYVRYIIERFNNELSTSNLIIDKVKIFLTSAEDKLGSSETVLYLLQFMKYLGNIVPEYEISVMNLLTSNTVASNEKDMIFSSYQSLINSIGIKNITDLTLKNIQIINEYTGYSKDIAELMAQSGYIFESAVMFLYLNVPIEFHKEEMIKAIKDNLQWLLKRGEVFAKLRESILESSDDKNIKNYIFLFSEECPILSDKEFTSITYKYADDVILNLIPPSIVTSNELPMLVSFFNTGFRSNSITYNYLLFISKLSTNIAKDCFYKLNFDTAIKYSSFSAERKNTIKNIYRQILNLDSVSEKINFMKATRFMVSSWEDSFGDILRTNTNIQNSYIDAVNNAVKDSITNSTVKCVCSIPTFHPLNDRVTNRLYIAKKYTYYVVCKTLYNKRFILDTSDKLECLWDTYMQIFTGANYRSIKEYMQKNHHFLRVIMNNKSYVTFSVEHRNILAGILQDAYSIEEAINRGESFAISYYQKIAGFVDANADKMFLSIIANRTNLLRSNAIYNNCHDKLTSSAAKSQYTRLRKKYGYM